MYTRNKLHLKYTTPDYHLILCHSMFLCVDFILIYLPSFLLPGALLEKKTDLDKRGMSMSDYSNGMNKPMVCRPSALSKDPSDRSTYLDKVRH